jgi:replicative DNA helicase
MDRIPPQDVEVEKAVLAAMLLDPTTIVPILEILEPEYFYSTKHKLIFSAIESLFNRNESVDVVTVRKELKAQDKLKDAGGIEYLTEIVNHIASTAQAEAHAQIVAEKYIMRTVIERNTRIIEACYSNEKSAFELMADAQTVSLELLTKFKAQKTTRAVDRVGSVLQELQRNKWYKTGFPDLDDIIQLRPQTVVTVAARPRVGKSLFALNIADNLSKTVPVLFFSLEMSELGMHVRLMSRVSGYSPSQLLRGNDNVNWTEVEAKTKEHLSRRMLDFNFTAGLTVQEIRLAVLNYKTTHPDLALVVIDYLQIIAPSGKNYSREQEVAEIMRGVVQIAKEADVCVMPLAQLSRMVEMRGERGPQLSDLRESGAIENDSDVVLLLHRPELYGIANLYDGITESKDKIEVRVAKNRNERGGIVIMGFDGATMQVKSLYKPDEKKTILTPDDELPFDGEIPF